MDAFRVDTAKFVPHEFWNDFFHRTDPAAPGMLAVAKATGRDDFLAFGEVFEIPDPHDRRRRPEGGELPRHPAACPSSRAVLGFPLYAEIGRVFAAGQAHLRT